MTEAELERLLAEQEALDEGFFAEQASIDCPARVGEEISTGGRTYIWTGATAADGRCVARDVVTGEETVFGAQADTLPELDPQLVTASVRSDTSAAWWLLVPAVALVGFVGWAYFRRR